MLPRPASLVMPVFFTASSLKCSTQSYEKLYEKGLYFVCYRIYTVKPKPLFVKKEQTLAKLLLFELLNYF